MDGAVIVGVVGRVETLCLPASGPDGPPVMSGVGQGGIDTTDGITNVILCVVVPGCKRDP